MNRKFEGTGLGLFLVKKLVDLFGGAVVVKSEPGKGSCFSFWLPCEHGVSNSGNVNSEHD